MKILAIESSCDETAAAVVEDGRRIISNIIATQVEEHKLYGGVVPEIASRRHCESIVGVVDEALEKAEMKLGDIDAVAVTYAPGLIGALLVGVNFAKGLAFASGKPLIPVHHIKGHIAANYIAHPELEPPYICLAASGGHSQIMRVESYTKFSTVGRTMDIKKPFSLIPVGCTLTRHHRAATRRSTDFRDLIPPSLMISAFRVLKPTLSILCTMRSKKESSST